MISHTALDEAGDIAVVTELPLLLWVEDYKVCNRVEGGCSTYYGPDIIDLIDVQPLFPQRKNRPKKNRNSIWEVQTGRYWANSHMVAG